MTSHRAFKILFTNTAFEFDSNYLNGPFLNLTFFFRWMVNDDDRNAFGEEVNNDDADNIFNTRDTSGVSYRFY